MEDSSVNNIPLAENAGDSSSLLAPASDADCALPRRRLSRLDGLFLIILFLVAFFLVFLTGRGRYGLSWDEAYFYNPSSTAATWLFRILFASEHPVSAAEIDAAWSDIKELPSVVKLCLGISSIIFRGYIDNLTAYRLPAAVSYALTLVLMYALMFKLLGRGAALMTTFSYALMPRIFGHAHIGASESILALMTLCVVYCFLRGLDNPWWSVLSGVVFGLALNTKVNAIFLPLILLPWAHVYYRRRYANNFFALVFLSPIVMVLTWPWLWHNTIPRLLEYFYFFAKHQFTAVFYFGQKYNYGSILAPWHYPFVMTYYTIPPLIFFFILVGVAATVRDIRRCPICVLFLWGAIMTLAISAMPSSPKYDGVRLFITAFIFMAPLAGIGCTAIYERLPKGGAIFRGINKRDLIIAACIIVVVAGGVTAVIRSHPDSLSYYNIFAGGIRGAYNKGMETTYWGEAVNDDVLRALNELPKGAHIKTLALHDEVFDLLQEWGCLRADLRINKGLPPYDYHILLVRKGFFARPEWCLFQKWRPLKVFEHHGVPLVIIFKTGPDFERAWQQMGGVPQEKTEHEKGKEG